MTIFDGPCPRCGKPVVAVATSTGSVVCEPPMLEVITKSGTRTHGRLPHVCVPKKIANKGAKEGSGV